MNKQFVCIPSENNEFTPIASKSEILHFYYSLKPLLRFHHYDAFIVCDDIISKDLCVIDGPDYAYIEECESIDLKSDRPVFYGTGGTRSLLCDAKKIIATSNASLQSDKIRSIREFELIPLLKEMNKKLQVPRFMMK